MRDRGLSLKQALKRAGTTYKTVFRYAGSALQKGASGRWRPAGSWDRLVRPVEAITRNGLQLLHVHDSRSARKIVEHREAVWSYLRTGETTALSRFQGEFVQINGECHYLAADPERLRGLGSGAGQGQ